MEIQRYEILEKVKENEIYVASPSDFRITKQPDQVDIEILLSNPKITHYCFDEKGENAVFIESDTEIDICAEPFFFMAQYRKAKFLYRIDVETFCELASKIEVQNERISFVHSVGRCGSTLVSKALASIPSVASYSEPDTFTNLLALRHLDSYSAERLMAAANATVRWTLRPHLHNASISHWSIKFRSQVTEIASVLDTAFPGCKNLFLYRDAGSWLASAYRAFIDHEHENDIAYRQELEDFFRSVHTVVSEYIDESTPMPVTQSWYLSWVAVVESYLECCDKNTHWIATSFDQIKREPQKVVKILLAHCGIELEDWAEMNKVLNRDSQSGSHLAQSEVGNLQSIPQKEADRLKNLISIRPLIKKLERGIPNLVQV